MMLGLVLSSFWAECKASEENTQTQSSERALSTRVEFTHTRTWGGEGRSRLQCDCFLYSRGHSDRRVREDTTLKAQERAEVGPVAAASLVTYGCSAAP